MKARSPERLEHDYKPVKADTPERSVVHVSQVSDYRVTPVEK